MNLNEKIPILLVAQSYLILGGCFAPKVDKKPALQLPSTILVGVQCIHPGQKSFF